VFPAFVLYVGRVLFFFALHGETAREGGDPHEVGEWTDVDGEGLRGGGKRKQGEDRRQTTGQTWGKTSGQTVEFRGFALAVPVNLAT